MSTPIVLALPRGGVPVAVEVADALHAPLDVLVVRKLGVPDRPELAFGALATGGIRVLDNDVLWRQAHLDDATIAAVTARETAELARREEAYRPGRPALALAGCAAVLVDDGIATGATMRAAVDAVRTVAARVVVATPVSSARAARMLSTVARVITVLVPPQFTAVGAYYRDFEQLTDEQVLAALR